MKILAQNNINMKKLIKNITLSIVFLSMIYSSSHTSYAKMQSSDENWYTYHMVGKFKDLEPPKSDIFIFQYKITNGVIESFDGVPNASMFMIKTNADDKGIFELKFPRNYPYTNDLTDYTDDFIVLLNNREIKYTMEKDECYFVFSIPFSASEEIKIAWTYLLSSPYPIRGDDVPERCIKLTIADNLPPLQQFNAGTDAAEIKCRQDHQLIIKLDGHPACVKSDTKLKLIERGWAKPV
ncbi:MAG: hypothetical protein HZA84_04435 [Thaumarchaeota archaeon]|nr:hypothetical protein [Nitrososphaerota archaeon]